VIEGIGDHGCEYMTGGCVVILGETGRNFAAGMSGGVAYALADVDSFRILCNLGTVELEKVVETEDIEELYTLISKHADFTQSTVAKELLSDWPNNVNRFVKVMPTDYKRVLTELKQERRLQLANA
jgi:glutamate synthase (NADPH/NADH) large chain